MKVPLRPGLVALVILLGLLGTTGLAFSQAAPKPLFGFSLDLNYDYRYAPDGDLVVEDGTYKSGIDIQRDYYDRAPFARMALGYGSPQGLAIALETTFRNKWEGEWDKADNLPGTGQSSSILDIEGFFITRGVAYWRSPVLSFAFGRDQVDYGGILYGSLLPSSRLPYLDNLRAKAKLGNFSIDWMLATIQALKSWDGVDVDPNAGATGTSYYGWESDVNPTTILEVMNRFSWKLGTFTIGITDHAMIARRNNFFELADFFPVSARHQTAVEQTNNSLVMDLAWSPLPGLDLAAQGGLDDVNLNDVGYSDTGTPTTPAVVAGGRYRGTLGPVTITTSAEVGYTHWCWGNYDGTQIDVGVGDVGTLMRFQARYLIGSGAILLPLTSPYGPGAFWVKTSGGLSLDSLKGFFLGYDFLYLAKNADANLISTAVYDNTTIANAEIIHYTSLSFPLSYTWKDWTASVSPGFVAKDGDVRFIATILASYKLRTGSSTMAESTAWASPASD